MHLRTRLLASIFALSLPVTNVARADTISDIFKTETGESKISGFAGPVAKHTQLLDHEATIYGGRAAALWNQRLYFGSGFYSLRSEIVPAGDPYGRELDFSYAALIGGYNILTDKILHGTLLVNYGWGKAGLKDGVTSESGQESFDVDDKFTIFEPELLLEMNVSNFLRVAVGGSYRFVYGMDLTEIKESELEGWTTIAAVNFGGF